MTLVELFRAAVDKVRWRTSVEDKAHQEEVYYHEWNIHHKNNKCTRQGFEQNARSASYLFLAIYE